MVDVSNESPSLRERKKLRTRAVLIDAAIDLCLKQGYQQTTVEQIAAAADVSTRTFSRYFPTKDAVFVTLLDDYYDEVAVELEAVEAGVGPLEAMRRAHTGLLTRVVGRRAGRLTTDRIATMLRVFNGAEALQQAVVDFRHEATQDILAKRMGVDRDDPSLRVVNVVFSAVIVDACGDLVSDTDTIRLGPQIIMDRLNASLERVAWMTRDLQFPSGGAHYERAHG
ncbi:TetR/AcrR family transcriptional regulator [Mycolicibacterium sp. P1-18]|uniref:TetR/AcrR family transcriptional regulator n=1 Tax=Mycolicibacterium sp. P1-18 TaxID=2024615 RepID=UPI0011F27BF2|nr:TetR/AcrR family transcriptional regulator [Mycolicibacterium sp. P1-18]KAA0096735.1 TetR/AcrR family transcriptional regulator [Mycolicibacterium sp. P1-18]